MYRKVVYHWVANYLSIADGGGLSSNHPGMRGIFLIIEATRQLRGQCGPRQVENAMLAVAHGSGGLLSSQATTILGR